MLRKLTVLFVITIILIYGNPAFSSPIVGTHSFTSYYDLNTNDGVVIEQSVGSLTITDGGAPQEYNFVDYSYLGSISGTLVDSGYVASFPSTPYNLGNENLMDYFVVSNGYSMGSVQLRQSISNPLSTSFSVATWQEGASPITIDDMVGDWILYFDYSDPNLRNFSDRFEPRHVGSTFNISKTSNSVITLNWDYFHIDMNVSGNVAYADTPVITNDGHQHLLGMLFDENGLLSYHVTSELYDPTDVSIGMMLGTKQSVSEPITLLLLMTGIISLVGCRSQFVIKSEKHNVVRNVME